MEPKKVETYYAKSRKDWRRWLINHHASKPSIWLVCYKQQAQVPTLSWSDAVEEALCFGWIDSTRRPYGQDSFIQFFTKRKPTSVWSNLNKAKVERLIADGQMTEAGLRSIEVAKQNGSWNILEEVEALVIPADLEEAFKSHKGARPYFMSLSKSGRKAILQWLVLAKRPETRQKRINEIASLAGKHTKPKQFR